MRWLAGILAMLAASLILGAVIPENRGWRPTADGVVIWIDSTAIHTEIIMPVRSQHHDWRRSLAFPGGLAPESHVSFSWGEGNFFLQTPGWADLRLDNALRALFASGSSLIHVYHLRAPAGRPIRLSKDEFRLLVEHLDRQFASGAAIAGYGPTDVFFPAHGRYSIINTCNQWTRDALAAAGVSVGRWTPLPVSLMWRFSEQEQDYG